NIQSSFDPVLPDLIIDIAPHAELRASFILERFVKTIGVPESRAQTENSCLPEQVRIAREVPVSIHQEVSGIGVKDLIDSQRITIATLIQNKISQNQAHAQLTPPGQIVNRLALNIR